MFISAGRRTNSAYPMKTEQNDPSDRQLLLLLGFYWKRIGALPPLTGKECALNTIFSLPFYVLLVNLVILDIGEKISIRCFVEYQLAQTLFIFSSQKD